MMMMAGAMNEGDDNRRRVSLQRQGTGLGRAREGGEGVGFVLGHFIN